MADSADLAQIRVPCELRVVHKRYAEPPPLPSGATHEVVLPHCGPEDYLRLSLDSLLQQTQPANISVAIDQAEAGAGFLADIADKTRVEAYQLAPCPVGPYVARHAMSLRSRADAVAYQDSKLKALLRSAEARTVTDLWATIREAFTRFSSAECRNYLVASGYDAYDPA